MKRFGVAARFLVTMLGIILTMQLMTSWVVLSRSRQDAEAHVHASLASGGRIFQRLVEVREDRLLESVSVLVSDFGLKQAVATADRPTIESALANHGARIEADLTFYVDLEEVVGAWTPPNLALDAEDPSLRELLDRARDEGRASGVLLANGRPHQIVLAPVKAPLTIGWVGMGFELDAVLARELRRLTSLEVAFWSVPAPGGPPHIASTHGMEGEAELASALAAGELRSLSGDPVLLPGSDWISLSLRIGDDEQHETGAILRTSSAEAFGTFHSLRADLIRFFALSVALAFGGALVTSRRLTRPIAALVEATRALSAGHFETRLEVHSSDEIGDLAETFCVMQEALADREREILYHSSHDGLTRLPNRSAVPPELTRRLGSHGDEAFAAIVLDIDRLKDVNGTLGAAIGDEVLCRTAERLRSLAGVDWLARIGGDEFLVIAPRVGVEELQAQVEGWIRELGRPHAIRGAHVTLDLAAGFAVAPDDAADADVLLRRAEMALASAKDQRVPVARYEAGLEEANQRRVGILIELERAIERDELELHYQPKLDVRTRRVHGVEALVRWEHHRMGRMNPAEFVAVAEQAGSIDRLSRWVVDAALAQREAWIRAGLDLEISINLSAIDLSQGSLAERLAERLRESPKGAAGIQIEVTESAIMTDPVRAAESLRRIREIGIGVAIDDFGTGHSSLAQLRNLPSDELKIDQTFVRFLREGTVDDVIVRSAIDLAHSLGLEVVAEGVEDRTTWRLLEARGCDRVQGYWIARPMPADQLVLWLDRFEKEGLDE